MDILIKNNIIKKNKIIVDVGDFAVKILDVRYAAKRININSAKVIDSSLFKRREGYSFGELAKRVDEETLGTGRKDICISLPNDFYDNKVVVIKNKKDSEIPKILKKDYYTFGRVSPITHVVDYAFLGKREEQGDTVGYYLISAIQKSIASELISAFAEHKLKITSIVSGVYNQVCLSELFFDEYEHLNRLFVDFGTDSIRITAFAEGVAVYTRSVDIGFSSFENLLFESQETAGKSEIKAALTQVGMVTDLLPGLYGDKFALLDKDTYTDCLNKVSDRIISEIDRIIDLCSSNDISVTKLYMTGYVIKGLREKLQDHLGTDCEYLSLGKCYEKEGKTYSLSVNSENIDAEFTNALGMAVYPMI